LKKSLIILLASLATTAFASDNWQTSDGSLQWRTSDGTLCWRDSNWTPATAAKGCDGWLAPKAAAKASVTITKVTLQADTLFDFDKSIIKPEGQKVLNKLATDIKALKLEVAIVVGNTDSIGTDAYNLALGERRAVAVKAYLSGQGVPSAKIYTESKGKSNPVASNATAEGRAKNRRVDVEVVGTK
jgi:OOP family OmpA-OmpF porin